MMAALVLELQKEALGKDVGLTDLLRKAYFVARKLKVKELEEWVSHELNGYPSGTDLPPYRTISGTMKVWNPYHGWQTVMFESSKTMDALSTRQCSQAASEIEHILQNSKDGGSATMDYSAEVAGQIMSSIGIDLRPSLHIPLSALHRILDSIKNLILNWSLKLEEDGILGDDVSFSDEEIRRAAQANYNITNIYGNVVDSQLQQGTQSSRQKSRK
ncbi:AbiTii domain-containing protein [Bdellovibrio bacteriovorus]|uniref:AbiTii domain-containing protein n=1 Tax=Bdellovibrio bacteriovorus TaxID=959 RepID=UPI000683F4C7|nr:hypothetical protein [Bdellovibrio bacteriovorus]